MMNKSTLLSILPVTLISLTFCGQKPDGASVRQSDTETANFTATHLVCGGDKIFLRNTDATPVKIPQGAVFFNAGDDVKAFNKTMTMTIDGQAHEMMWVRSSWETYKFPSGWFPVKNLCTPSEAAARYTTSVQKVLENTAPAAGKRTLLIDLTHNRLSLFNEDGQANPNFLLKPVVTGMHTPSRGRFSTPEEMNRYVENIVYKPDYNSPSWGVGNWLGGEAWTPAVPIGKWWIQWLGGGVGVHGNVNPSLFDLPDNMRYDSHGCVRMRNDDVEALALTLGFDHNNAREDYRYSGYKWIPNSSIRVMTVQPDNISGIADLYSQGY